MAHAARVVKYDGDAESALRPNPAECCDADALLLARRIDGIYWAMRG